VSQTHNPAGGRGQLPFEAAAPRSPQITFCERLEVDAEQHEDIEAARLVTRFQAGDQEAVAAIYSCYFDRVYGYMKVLFNDPHEAENATSDVFAKVIEALPRYERRKQPFRAWLFVVARNTGLDRLRVANRVEPMDPAEINDRRELTAAPESGLSAVDWISDGDLLVFIERLPLAQRQVLALRYLLDLRVSEIAEVLGRSRTDVSTLQYRALKFLEQRLRAVGRAPRQRGLSRMRRWGTPATVARSRRFALHA
jgi:RNA polymerase sigma-70 factor (ECF subfamily)